MFHTLKLAEGQDIVSIALTQDNTNLLVSTSDKQLIIFTDPSVSFTFYRSLLLVFCIFGTGNACFKDFVITFSYETSLFIVLVSSAISHRESSALHDMHGTP